MKKEALIGILSGIAATSIWGGMYVVSKAILDTIPPFSLIFLRLILGILSLLIISRFRPKRRLTTRQFWPIFLTGLIGYGISIGFQFVGTDLSSASNGSLVTSSTPAFVLLFAVLLLREKGTPRRLIALVLATIGVVAVIDPRTADFSSTLFWGNLSLVAAALTWALYSVLIRKVTRETDVLTTSLVAFMGGLPVCIPMGIWEASSQGYGTITWGVVAGILFIGLISTALAMYLWNTAFARLEAGIASLTFFAQPVVGILFGSLFLGEKITPLFVAGGVLIGLGILIAARE